MVPEDASQKKIAFFGRIMANVSHEFNNVITVISELAGLLKDLTLMAQKGREIPPEKLTSISDSISRQVTRGKHLITHMNRFSHSTDEPIARVEMGQIVENMKVLTDRLFKNRQTDISYTPAEHECSLTTDPFELRYIIFSCMKRFLEAGSPNLKMTLHSLENGRELELLLSGDIGAENHEIAAHVKAMQKRVVELGGRLLFEKHEDSILLRLILPAE